MVRRTIILTTEYMVNKKSSRSYDSDNHGHWKVRTSHSYSPGPYNNRTCRSHNYEKQINHTCDITLIEERTVRLVTTYHMHSHYTVRKVPGKLRGKRLFVVFYDCWRKGKTKSV